MKGYGIFWNKSSFLVNTPIAGDSSRLKVKPRITKLLEKYKTLDDFRREMVCFQDQMELRKTNLLFNLAMNPMN